MSSYFFPPEPVVPKVSVINSAVKAIRKSFKQGIGKLNGSSIARPHKNWADYNAAYRRGEIDFEHPSRPPTELGEGVDFVAPIPLHENLRQRTVDSLRLIVSPPIRSQQHCENMYDTDRTGENESVGSGHSLQSSSSSSTGSSVSTSLSEVAKYRESLQLLCAEAKKEFNVAVCICNLSDGGQHVFIGEQGFSAATVMERGSTPCSHSTVKASSSREDCREPFVVCDLADENEWRFRNGNFGGSRFYASAPIFMPSPLGDDSHEYYPIGTFCILDSSPRSSFSQNDRIKLQDYANRAVVAITDWEIESGLERGKNNDLSLSDWRRSSIVQRTSPQLPSLPEDVESPTESLITTSTSPISKRMNTVTTRAVPASPSFNPGVASVFNLSCKLLSETLELTWCYIVEISLGSASDAITPAIDRTRGSPIIRLIADHNALFPPACFDVAAHIIVARMNPTDATLFIDPEAVDNFSTGILANIGIRESADGEILAYLLGGFSDQTSRVLVKQDWSFVRAHSRDLAPFLSLVETRA